MKKISPVGFAVDGGFAGVDIHFDYVIVLLPVLKYDIIIDIPIILVVTFFTNFPCKNTAYKELMKKVPGTSVTSGDVTRQIQSRCFLVLEIISERQSL